MKKRAYAMQPEGYEKIAIVLVQIMKAIYGLPEAMNLFIDMFKRDIISIGFVQTKADLGLYVLREGEDHMWLPTVVYTSDRIRNTVFERLSELYRIDDRGPLRSALAAGLAIQD